MAILYDETTPFFYEWQVPKVFPGFGTHAHANFVALLPAADDAPMMTTVRLFIAATVPEDIAHDVGEAAAPLLAHPQWRRSPKDQWHVTALFIGERHEEDLPMITDALRSAASHEAFTLRNGHVVAMPERSPSMLWLRFAVHEGLTSLHHALTKACGAQPSPFDPYWPHITLARSRAKVLPWSDARVVVPALPMDELVLFRSDPAHGHRIHTALASCSLRRTGPTDPVAAP